MKNHQCEFGFWTEKCVLDEQMLSKLESQRASPMRYWSMEVRGRASLQAFFDEEVDQISNATKIEYNCINHRYPTRYLALRDSPKRMGELSNRHRRVKVSSQAPWVARSVN